ncbi:hypothetical protein PV325_010924, partial [Microctonus aethiopoides]
MSNVSAKILAIADDYDTLDKMVVSDCGDISPANKTFNPQLLMKKKLLNNKIVWNAAPIMLKQMSCGSISQTGSLIAQAMDNVAPNYSYEQFVPEQYQDEMRLISVDSDGKINAYSQNKIFPEKIIEESATIAAEKKKLKIKQKKFIRTNEAALMQKPCIYDMANNVETSMNSTLTPAMDVNVESSNDIDDTLIGCNDPPTNDVSQYFYPFPVTQRDIQHIEHLLAAMKAAYERQKKQTSFVSDDLNNEYIESGHRKVEIEPGTGIYFSENVFICIERRAEQAKGKWDWKVIVREALLEVYGGSIKNYSATGSRSNSRPAINPQLFKAIYYWVNRKCDKPVSKEDLIRYINHIASNKRKYQKSKEVQDEPRKKKRSSKPAHLHPLNPSPLPSQPHTPTSVPSSSSSSSSIHSYYPPVPSPSCLHTSTPSPLPYPDRSNPAPSATTSLSPHHHTSTPKSSLSSSSSSSSPPHSYYPYPPTT